MARNKTAAANTTAAVAPVVDEFAAALKTVMVSQLHNAGVLLEGQVQYRLRQGAFTGANRWVTINLSSPQYLEDGRVGVRLVLAYILPTKGKDAPVLGSTSGSTKWVNIQTALLAVDELLESDGFIASDSTKATIRRWSEQNAIAYGEQISSSMKLQLIASDQSEIAFTLRYVINPTTGAPASNPIGIDGLYVANFTLKGAVKTLRMPTRLTATQPAPQLAVVDEIGDAF